MTAVETLGNYEIRRTLGRGAMGIVYEGWDPRIERSVAIKTVRIPTAADDDMREEFARFRREAQAAGRLIHPNIVTVYEYGEAGDIAFIAMEYVGGPSLKTLLEQQGRLALPEILQVMRDLLAGLQYSHERGVVHRDIKPANIMLTTADRTTARAKIADFGIARIESSNMTQTGTIMGTPAYMSPEQLLGQPVDARTDIYAAGVLLYQLLTGERPFEGGLSAIMHKVLNTEPPAPSQIAVTVPPAFDAVVRKAMAKRPDDRYPSAAAFAEALTDVATPPEERTIVIPRAAPAAPAEAAAAIAVVAPRRNLPLIAAAVVGVLAVAGGGAFWLMRPSAPPAVIAPLVVVAPPVVPLSPVVPVSPVLPVQPVTPPPPPQPVYSALSVLDRLGPILSGQSCALVDGAVNDNRDVSLTGFASAGAGDEIRRGIEAIPGVGIVGWRVASTDTRYCSALSALAPVGPGAGGGDPRLALGLADGGSTLRDGERIRVRVAGLPFLAYVIVDYIASDGSVQHLYPQQADPALRTVADPIVPLSPGRVLNLGDPAPGHPEWAAGEPFGTDMILAVASSQPLFAAPRPGNSEDAASYVRELAAAVERARAAGVRLSANVRPVDVVAK